ncbi:MAG: hypothetical protein ABIP42_10035, partial [Planctomycetota bacterium]
GLDGLEKVEPAMAMAATGSDAVVDAPRARASVSASFGEDPIEEEVVKADDADDVVDADGAPVVRAEDDDETDDDEGFEAGEPTDDEV